MINTKKVNTPKLDQYVGKYEVLMNALEAVDESVYVFDAQTNKPLYANRSILEILGYSPEQIDEMGNEWSEFVVHPEDYPHLSNYIVNYSSLTPGNRSRVVYRVRDAKGVWHSAESTGLVLSTRDSDNKLVLGTSRILSESRMIKPLVAHDHRCSNCAKLLGKEKRDDAIVEVKCGRCGEFNNLPLR